MQVAARFSLGVSRSPLRAKTPTEDENRWPAEKSTRHPIDPLDPIDRWMVPFDSHRSNQSIAPYTPFDSSRSNEPISR